jgi:hypothetical protein
MGFRVPTDDPVVGQAVDVWATRTSGERRVLLTQALRSAVIRGGRIESQGDFEAVVVHGKRVNHILHLILTVFTLGLWIFVWGGLILFAGEKRELVTVDGRGNTGVQRLYLSPRSRESDLH